ncbi:autophagy-related protein 2 homolog b-like [Plakobranchus ocellatus]|uniref:Autophagy-related protein 2 n=1 Tax=Plakobranchus ocellatus TaxID=259542 RepID=A0AAV4BS18_9GAST|nr:autophagy-related protein 2 homolog b-like [Plakobranchus ocellatus]
MESIKNYFKTIGKGFFNKLFERSIRVYIQNHLGEFLIGKLSTDQVDVGLDGGSFASLYLNAEAINERLDVVNVPFVLVDGYVDVLHLRIPWADISTESIIVEVDGLMLTLKLKEEEIDDGMDMKSMLESMTASMVEEMMKADVAAADIQKISEVGKEASPFESIELMSEFIQSITSRIQVSLSNVVIKTEKSPGVCMELMIESLEYYDKDCATKKDSKGMNNKATPAGFSNKVLEVSKVTLNVEEIWDRNDSPAPLDPIQQSSVAFDIAMSSPPTSGNYMQQSCMSQSIYAGATSVDSTEKLGSKGRQTGGLIPIVSMEKTQTINIQIKNDDMLPGPSARALGAPINGPILMEKAKLGKELGISFVTCSGWLGRFKRQHGIVFKVVSGEAASVDMSTVDTWRGSALQQLLENYNADDIFNTDKTGVFLQMPSRQDPGLQRKCLHWRKKSKGSAHCISSSQHEWE